MARIHAQAANFTFNSVAIEDELNQIDMAVDVDMPEITSFADAGKAFVEGKYGHMFEVKGAADFAASQGDATIFGAIGTGAKTAIYDPVGGGTASSTNPLYTASCYVKSYKLHSGVAAEVKYEATFQGSGLLDRDVTP